MRSIAQPVEGVTCQRTRPGRGGGVASGGGCRGAAAPGIGMFGFYNGARDGGLLGIYGGNMEAMQITPQIAVYVLLLVPGLLGHALFCAFTYTAKPTWSGRTVVAILLSAVSYASLSLLRMWDNLAWLPDPVALLNASEKGIPATVSANSLLCVLGACVLSVVFSMTIVAGHNHRTMFRLAQKVGLTTKSGFESEWDGCMMLRARTRWVMVLMKDRSAFTGWVESHDIASTERGLVLSKVREYDKDGNDFLWPADELLYINSLTDVRALRLIPNKEPCNEQANTADAGAASAQDRDTIREYKPEPSPEGAAARFTDQAVTVTGQDGLLNTTNTSKEAEHG